MTLVRMTWASKEAKAMARRAAWRIRDAFPQWRVRAEEFGGAPPRELMRAADEWEADLLAVGSPHRSLLGRLLLGSVSRTVVADAVCSVRVGRPRSRRGAAAAMIAGGNREAAARSREIVEWATGALRQIGLDASAAFASGDARCVLVEEARAWGADSVFVGSHSFGGALERSRAGRVSTGVAMDAPCSVEVVRAL